MKGIISVFKSAFTTALVVVLTAFPVQFTFGQAADGQMMLGNSASFHHQCNHEKTSTGGTVSRSMQYHQGYPIYGSVQAVYVSPNGSRTKSKELNANFSPLPTHILQSEKVIATSSLPVGFVGTTNPELMWYPVGDHYKLTWCFTGNTNSDLLMKQWIIDAGTGVCIGVQDISCQINSTGTALTEYHGTRTIGTDYNGGIYQLKNTSRGTGIETYNLNNQLNYGSVSSYTDNDNTWNNGEFVPVKHATDAHFCAEAYYDYLSSTFSRNSLDNSGMKLISYLNYGTAFNNAFWNGNAVVYGSGTVGTGPMTTLDIAGHEFTHGLLQKMTGLLYAGEPGTINEAVSDMMGASLEHAVVPSQSDWLIGEDTGTPIRSMEDPKDYNQPDTYHGTNWYYGTGDNGGVHINSGFLNKWFYLLSEGGSGTNDNGTAYNVQGIGIENAINLIYLTLQTRVVSTTGFVDFREHTISASIEIYGSCSPEMYAVLNSWKAVGLYQNPITMINSSSQAPLCEGDTVQLTASGASFGVFTWYKNGTIIPQQSSATSIEVTSNGNYSLTENRCGQVLTAAPLVVSFKSRPVVTATSVTTCQGTSVVLGGLPIGGVTSVSNPYQGPSTNYSYTYTSSNGCSASAVAAITTKPLPQIQLGQQPDSIHIGQLPIILTASPSNGIWSGNGVSNGIFHPEQAGLGIHDITYNVTGTSGCDAEKSMTIVVLTECNPLNTSNSISGPDKTLQSGEIVEFTSGFTEEHFVHLWEVPMGVSIIGPSDKSVIRVKWNDRPGEVAVNIGNECGEEIRLIKKITISTSKISLKAFPVPAISEVTIEGFSEGDELEVYDVSGRIVPAIIENYNTNGTAKISGLNPGVYFVTVKGNPELKANILITGKN